MGDTKTRKKTEEQTVVKEPPMYKVLLLNDHYTSMEFVVLILQQVFFKGIEEATQIMLAVHQGGKGIAGIFTREVAEMKIALVTQLARQSGFPLRCTIEEV